MRLTSLSGGTFAICLLALAAACSGGSDDDDAPISCTSNADCVSENPCLVGRCGIDGVCAFQSANDGPAPNEIEGDCKRATCLDGQPMYTNDNSDVLEDDEPCTDDTCTNGVPMNAVSEDGSSCDVGGGSGVCQQGTCIVLCVEGNAASQCDDDDVCTDDICVPCDADTCFGQGQCAHEPGNGAGPDDLNDCTTDLCDAGVPVHEPAPAGTACTSGGNVCNAAGDCVACANDADCEGVQVSNCYVAVCDSGECVEELAPAGTIAVNADMIGDCHTPICSGTGSYASEVDDDDLPVDENPCTTESCMDGNAMYVAAEPGTSCGDNGEMCGDYSVCCAPFVHDEPTDVVALRQLYTSTLSFSSYLATFNTATGATGDLDTQPLGIDPEQIVFDPVNGHVYYLANLGIGMLADCGNNQLEGVSLPAPDTATELSGPAALAWDPNTEQVLLASTGGTGVLYGYDPADGSWAELGSLSNFEASGPASYFSSTDKLYMADTTWATTLSRFTAAGAFEDTVSLTAPLVGSGGGYDNVQIRESGTSLYYIVQGYTGASHFYSFVQVNPATGVTNVLYP